MDLDGLTVDGIAQHCRPEDCASLLLASRAEVGRQEGVLDGVVSQLDLESDVAVGDQPPVDGEARLERPRVHQRIHRLGLPEAREDLRVEAVFVAGRGVHAAADPLPIILGRAWDAVAVVATSHEMGGLKLLDGRLHAGEL